MSTRIKDTIAKALPIAGPLLVIAALAALAMLTLAGPAYRLELLSLGGAFGMMGWAARVGVLVMVVSLIYLALAAWSGRLRGALITGILALVAGVIAVGVPYQWRSQARSVPPIHDITTDTQDPPPFEAIAPLRADAPNPVAYPGEETASQQREAYPDLETAVLNASPETVFNAAVTVTDSMGWERVAADRRAGRIEATDTTTWFGFKDDVVIRIRPHDNGTELDIRSKSRVGRSDVGTNAARIRNFLDRLRVRLNRAGGE